MRKFVCCVCKKIYRFAALQETICFELYWFCCQQLIWIWRNNKYLLFWQQLGLIKRCLGICLLCFCCDWFVVCYRIAKSCNNRIIIRFTPFAEYSWKPKDWNPMIWILFANRNKLILSFWESFWEDIYIFLIKIHGYHFSVVTHQMIG